MILREGKMTNHINEIVAELNDAGSLSRSELDATEILPLLPIGKSIYIRDSLSETNAKLAYRERNDGVSDIIELSWRMK